MKNEIIIPLADKLTNETAQILTIDSIMFEGNIKESGDFVALGDEFETFLLEDSQIRTGKSFISDNFFVVFVDEDNNG